MPGTQLHKSKEKNNDQDSNERSNQNSNKKRQPNDHARIQPLSRHGIATKIAPEKNQDNKKYSNQSSKKNGNQNHNANPGPGNNPSLLDKTIVLGPQNEVRKAYQKPTPWARSSPVLGVRYPELVKATADGWKYGRYVSTEATLQGGFLPVFWDIPKSNMHAVSDLGALVE